MSQADPAAERGERVLQALERTRAALTKLFGAFRLRPDVAEDMIQQVFLLALLRVDKIQHLEAWMFGTARILCLNRLRSAKVRTWLHLEEIGEPAYPAPQEGIAAEIDLERGLAQLARRRRSVTKLRGQGFQAREIAAKVGFAPSSIRRIARRARAQLAMALSDYARK